jgi:hypothetical protein
MVRVFDMADQVSEIARLPMVASLPASIRSHRRLERFNDLFQVQIPIATGLFQRFLPAAAIIDAELFEHAGRAWNIQCHFADGLGGIKVHGSILLAAGSFAIAVLNLERCRALADDFCHGQLQYAACHSLNR